MTTPTRMSTTTRTENRRADPTDRGTRPGRRAVIGVVVTLISLHLAGGILILVATDSARDPWPAVALGMTAYLLGARHAFDADHIAAIDNTTRRLHFDGRPSSTVGFWFSLGHSSVVLVAVGLLLAGVSVLFDTVNDESSALRQVFGYWGASVSLVFLIAFGCLNLVQLVRLTRRGRRNELHSPGVTAPISLLIRPFAHLVDRPSRMYGVGLLFGLGFDTAATIGLFVTAGAASAAISWQLAIALPLLFAAGMCVFDSIDGAVMSRMYTWSSASAARRTGYDILITGLSVAAAFVVAGLGLASLLADVSGSSFVPPEVTDLLGFGIVAVLLAAWTTTYLVQRSRAATTRDKASRAGAASTR